MHILLKLFIAHHAPFEIYDIEKLISFCTGNFNIEVNSLSMRMDSEMFTYKHIKEEKEKYFKHIKWDKIQILKKI